MRNNWIFLNKIRHSIIRSIVILLVGAHKGPFNWLTQSSLDTYAETSFVTMETQTTQSTLLFSVGTGDSQGAGVRRHRPGPGFGKQKLSAPKASTTTAKKDGKMMQMM